jgi:farnesyl-diphosphate farnesyltransferase
MPSLYDLLLKTSRTFALAIPLLPEPTRSTTCLAYLLFRVADTLEDAGTWSRVARLDALAEWTANEATHHDGYNELLAAVPQVLTELARAEAGIQRIVRDHALRTVRGMRETLERGDAGGNVRITTVEDLRAYCYIVAGIVGELLTELFVHDCPSLASVKDTLVENQVKFGEGLQLVNILKDQAQDAEEGRTYLPGGVLRSDIVELAREDLHLALRRAGRGHARAAAEGRPRRQGAARGRPSHVRPLQAGCIGPGGGRPLGDRPERKVVAVVVVVDEARPVEHADQRLARPAAAGLLTVD